MEDWCTSVSRGFGCIFWYTCGMSIKVWKAGRRTFDIVLVGYLNTLSSSLHLMLNELNLNKHQLARRTLQVGAGCIPE